MSHRILCDVSGANAITAHAVSHVSLNSAETTEMSLDNPALNLI
jgi:hypothetical protein